MKLIRFTLTVAHFFIMIFLLGTLLNAYVPPKTFPYLNLLSLAFPVLMILNLLLLIFWAVSRKKRGLVFLLLSLILINPTRRWVNYSEKSTEKPNLKIVTANIHSVQDGYGEIFSYFKSVDADVVLVQEYRTDFNIPGYPYSQMDHKVVAINSKLKIVSQKILVKTEIGGGLLCDIEVNGKIIRFISVYLHPFMFEKTKLTETPEINTYKPKVKYIVGKLIPTFKIHQNEIAEIRKAIDDSPYPVILAGDFNAVPNSYEYYHLGKNLKDTFMEVGNGSGTSFHDYQFPIRIDYIFCSKSIKPVNYQVDRSVKISDHYPVIAEFKID